MDMPASPAPLIICGVDELDGHCDAGIRHVISILDPGVAEPDIFRSFTGHERLDLRFHDVIDEHEGMIAPQRNDIERLLQFGRSIMRSRSQGRLLIHCHAGLSRSTAAAVLLLAQAQLDRPPEAAVSRMLEIRPNAWPNLRMIELGDELLRCDGKLIAAVRRHYSHLVQRYPVIERALAVGRHLRG